MCFFDVPVRITLFPVLIVIIHSQFVRGSSVITQIKPNQGQEVRHSQPGAATRSVMRMYLMLHGWDNK